MHGKYLTDFQEFDSLTFIQSYLAMIHVTQFYGVFVCACVCVCACVHVCVVEILLPHACARDKVVELCLLSSAQNCPVYKTRITYTLINYTYTFPKKSSFVIFYSVIYKQHIFFVCSIIFDNTIYLQIKTMYLNFFENCTS